MAHEHLRDLPLELLPTEDARVPWQAIVNGARVSVRINEFPEEPTLYTVFVDGERAFDLMEWPAAWRRPG